MNDQPNDRVSIWFKLLLDSRNINEPSRIGFPKAFSVSEILPLYKDELVSVEHIIIMLAKANYLDISNYNLNKIKEVSIFPKPHKELQTTFINFMFTLNLENTKKFLEKEKGKGPQLEFNF